MNLIYSADTAGLIKGTGKVRSEIVGVGQLVEQTKSKLGGLMAGVGAALGIGSMGAWVKQSMDAINSTRRMATELGTSTEAMSRLESVAKLSGISTEELSGGITKMERGLTEVAQTGGGKAAHVLEQFGLSAQELARQDPADTFKQLLGVLGQIQNPMERMKAAMDVFGRGSRPLLELVAKGKEGIEEMEASADKLGVSFSDIDAAKVQEASVAMSEIWETVAGVGRSIAIELAPWIHEAADKFIQWAKTGSGAANIVGQAMGWVTESVGYLADGLQLAQIGWEGFKLGALKALEGTIWGIKKLAEGIDWLYKKIGMEGTNYASMGAIDFLDTWKDTLHNMSDNKLSEIGALTGKKWAHETVAAFVNEVKIGSESRAMGAVRQAEKFRMPGTDDIEATGKASASKAMELGSSSAANTILHTFYGTAQKDTKVIAKNTGTMVDVLQKIAVQIAMDEGKSPLEVWDSF